jgi:two-component system, cell cycle response regulator DivK
MPSAHPQGSSAQPSVVLLLQDDTLELYDWVLTRDGFSTHATTDPAEALHAAVDADVIVTALKLRGSFDGIELVRRLRADARTSSRPVVMLSASVTPACRQQAIDAGCDLFLAKPCLPDELVEVLRQLLVQSKARRLESVTLRARAAALKDRAQRLLDRTGHSGRR